MTGYYAVQTYRTVGEMQLSRQQSIIPKLGIDLHMQAPTYPVVQVTNVGLGVALDVEYVLTFEGRGQSDSESRPWRANVIVPREFHRFYVPDSPCEDEPEGSEEVDSTSGALARRFARISIKGTMRDALGGRHTIDEVLEDLDGWLRVTTAAKASWEREPLPRIAQDLHSILEVLRRRKN